MDPIPRPFTSGTPSTTPQGNPAHRPSACPGPHRLTIHTGWTPRRQVTRMPRVTTLPPNVTCRRVTHPSTDRARRCLTSERSRASQPELQIIFESNAYLRPNFLLNADFQISKSIFTPCNFSQCWKGRYYCFEVPYLNFFWCNFNFIFDGDLLLLVITLECILTIFWQYVDKRTDRLTSTIQSFTFVLRQVLTISMHCIGVWLDT